MKMYAVSDIHARSRRLETLREVVADRRPDGVVIAGDIISYIRPRPVLAALEALSVPVFAVRGNSDPGGIEKHIAASANITSLHGRRITLEGIPLVGISGAIPVPFRTRIRWFEKRLFAQITALMDDRTILVVHPPPLGARDRVGGKFSAGSKGVRALVEETRPAVVICGHIHEDAGIDRIGPTLVVNCCMTGKYRGAMMLVPILNELSFADYLEPFDKFSDSLSRGCLRMA
jgi:uncharacterized protein